MVSESGIAHQILDAIDRVSEPKFDAFGFRLLILSDDVALNSDNLAFPFKLDWEAIDQFQKLVRTRKTWLCSNFGLTTHVTC